MLGLGAADWAAVWLTLKLASVVTFLLVILATPLAWWLAQSRSKWRAPIAALVAMPLVLPPTVLGFYVLLLLGPKGPLGQLMAWLGVEHVLFSFSGLVVASMVYSLPFVVQPIYTSMQAISPRVLEVAATLGASPLDRFITVVLPLSKTGFLTAVILGFAHTVGEFGVVLMVGGSIPESTRVVSIQIYEHVETLNYGAAHVLSAGLVLAAFIVLWVVYRLQHAPLKGSRL